VIFESANSTLAVAPEPVADARRVDAAIPVDDKTERSVIPDEASIVNFRRRLEQHLTAQLFAAINARLAARGMLVGRGTIVDATIIDAPPATMNAGGSCRCTGRAKASGGASA
jgi:IS5 family transposase